MINTIVSQTVDYLQNWTKKELFSILAENAESHRTPIIAQLGNRGYIVGNYAMQPAEQNWWTVSYRFNDDENKVFSSKVAALCYILYRHNNNICRADQIVAEDNDVRRWIVKSDQYYYRYRQAVKKKNLSKADLFFTRHQEALYRLGLAKSLLEKSLRSAKYFKL